ncbi:acyltransferase family protein [Hymenobacter sp. BRD67]|uniref:acyltransferase family protein n=1 Tax=Hymenobacter sp. BRD67 TaxID=2675877 RepID=UPI001564EF10|nr:acyltransferase [Hymenobacter sp. BRD67]QKG51617.1 acyltransferase [Hymenobacter sp. BRD67]
MQKIKIELKALTGLRFVAAFLVFIFHVNMRTKMLFLPWPVYNIVSHGALGVTVFFVLSGFLLTYSHLKDFPNAQIQTPKYILVFFCKRLARIYPVYLAGLFVFASLISLEGTTTPTAPLTMVADLTMTEAVFPAISMSWYGSGGWSVSSEIFFYLFFPFLLPLLLRISRQPILWILLTVVILAGTFGGFAYRLWPAYVSYSLMYNHPLFRCSEFIAGMISGLLVFRFQWRTTEWQALVMVGIAGTYIAGAGPRLLGFVAHNWLIVPAIICLLAALVDIDKTKFLRLLTHPVAEYAGRISYCFYLAQLPFFMIQDIRLGKNLPLFWWYGFATFLATTLVAILLHHVVEVPSHKWLMSKLNKRNTLIVRQP